MKNILALFRSFSVSFALACCVAAAGLLAPCSAHAQEDRDISGNVVSGDTGEPLPGVNVVAMGTQIGAATDAEGNYTLEGIPASVDSLRFSFVGFDERRVAIDGRSIIDVALQPTSEELGEVVVIGYGEQSEALLTESIESVGAEEIGEMSITSPEEALQGRVSGVQLSTANASPGAPVSVRVRGVGTVGNTQPLFVIDGVPVGKGASRNAFGTPTNALATINPQDIESISVLKDASAASVYGVRAANGVILIETKRGQSGTPQVSFDSYFGVKNTGELWDYNTTREYLALRNAANQNYNEQLGLSPGDDGYQELDPRLRNPSDELLNTNTDWLNEAVNQNAPIQNYNLSISGGTQDLNYYASGGYFASEGNVIDEGLQRYSFRINSDYNVADWLSFGENFTVSYTSQGKLAQGLPSEAGSMPPFFKVYDEDNSIEGNRYGFDGNFGDQGNTPRGGVTVGNAIATTELNTQNQGLTRLLGGLNGRVTFLEGFYFESRASLDLTLQSIQAYQLPYTQREVGLPDRTDRLNRNERRDYTQVFTNTLNYNNDFGDHTINALAGAELQLIRTQNLSGTAQNLVSTVENARVLGSSDAPTAGEFKNERNLVGFISRLKYDYADKYLLTASLRRDGASAFAPGNRWGTFPSISAAWRVGQEPFLEAIPALSELKLRGSWGQLGNSASVGPYAYIFNLGTGLGYGSGETYLAAASPGGFTNPALTWETVETVDFGVSGSFFENRLSYGATYYRRETQDLLFNTPVPAVTGFTSAPINVGTILNTGLELEASYFDQFGDLSFDLSANLTTVENEVTSLVEARPEFTQGGGYRTAVGEPIGYFYGYKTDGLYQDEEDVAQNALPDESASRTPAPGDVKFVDTGCDNGDVSPAEASADADPTSICEGGLDGEITAADRTRIGKTIPDLYYGLNLNLNWRGFDFGMLLQGEHGVERHNQNRRFRLGLGGDGRNSFTESADRWTPDNRDTDIPRAVATNPNGNTRFSDLWVEDASYLRVKNVQFGYSIPPSVAGGVFDQARVYVAVSNLFTFTGYKGLSPTAREFGDLNSVSNQLQAGTDTGLLPEPRTYRLGIQLQL